MEGTVGGIKEATNSPVSGSHLPIVRRTANDILCGRGVPILNYHGNIRLHNIIDSYRGAYLQSDRKAKPVLVRQIVREIKSGGARFLKRSGDDPDSWVEVNDDYAHEKVSHALRCKKAAAKSGSTSASASAIKASLASPSPTGTQQTQLPPHLFQAMRSTPSSFPSLPASFQPPQLQQRQHPYAHISPPSLLSIDPTMERISALSRLTSPRFEMASRLGLNGNPFAFLNSNLPSLGYENIFPPTLALPLAGTQSTVDSLTSLRHQRELIQHHILLAQALPTAQTPTNTPNERMQALPSFHPDNVLGHNPNNPTPLSERIKKSKDTTDGSGEEEKLKEDK